MLDQIKVKFNNITYLFLISDKQTAEMLQVLLANGGVPAASQPQNIFSSAKRKSSTPTRKASASATPSPGPRNKQIGKNQSTSRPSSNQSTTLNDSPPGDVSLLKGDERVKMIDLSTGNIVRFVFLFIFSWLS